MLEILKIGSKLQILTIEPAILLGFQRIPENFWAGVPRLILNLESQTRHFSLVHIFQLVCLLRES